MTKQTLKFLGRGSAFNPKEGSNSAFIKDNDTLFLIDCGEDTFFKIVNFKILDDVKNIHVFITHTHSDHYGSLSSLLYYAFYIKNIKAHVYCTDANLFKILNYSGHDGEYIKHWVYNNDVIAISNNLSFQPTEVRHTTTLNSSGLIIKYIEKEIYYSGDCNEVLMEAVDKIRSGYDIEYYQDTTTHSLPVHLHIKDLISSTTSSDRGSIYCMHIEGDDIFEIAKDNNLNVVKLYADN